MRKKTSTKVPLTTTPRQPKFNIWPVFIKLQKREIQRRSAERYSISAQNRNMKTEDGLNFIHVPQVIMYKSPTMTMQWSESCSSYGNLQQSPYTFIPDETCQQHAKAFDKGIECILRTQVRQNGGTDSMVRAA